MISFRKLIHKYPNKEIKDLMKVIESGGFHDIVWTAIFPTTRFDYILDKFTEQEKKVMNERCAIMAIALYEALIEELEQRKFSEN